MLENMSYKEMLMRYNGEWGSEFDQLNEQEVEHHEEVPTTEKMVSAPDVVWETEADGRVNFKLSDEFKRKTWKPWHKAIFVKLLGKRVSIAFMKKKLENMWAREGIIFVTDLENDYFLVRFEDQKDMDFSFTAGPWLIFDHYLAIRSWEPDFQPFQAAINRIVAWIRLPEFPLEYVNTELVKSIGNWLGKFVKVDVATTSLARGRFARMCVELDLNQPLQVEYKVEDRVKRIEYEGLHLICYTCGMYGHRQENCPHHYVQEVERGTHEKEEHAESKDSHANTSKCPAVDHPNFGPWMQVIKGRRNQGSDNVKGKKIQNTRKAENKFEVLTNQESQKGEDGNSGTMVVYQPPLQSSPHSKVKKSTKAVVNLVETESRFSLEGVDETDRMEIPNVESHSRGNEQNGAGKEVVGIKNSPLMLGATEGRDITKKHSPTTFILRDQNGPIWGEYLNGLIGWWPIWIGGYYLMKLVSLPFLGYFLITTRC
ncbi:uncharacterized protein LOC133286691 [Gastrolobium bilobum]|uniref:uncharacterized protein LOC133286691 n=1 Tax=Gastrolobium bilobum TaxID=150636 RepID=UPI002AB1F9C2|nr:uncharacterized protein LOC133286691 [Gastrolobium bilobum]